MYKRDVQMRGLGGRVFFHARELPQFFDKCCEGTTRDFLTSMPDSAIAQVIGILSRSSLRAK